MVTRNLFVYKGLVKEYVSRPYSTLCLKGYLNKHNDKWSMVRLVKCTIQSILRNQLPLSLIDISPPPSLPSSVDPSVRRSVPPTTVVVLPFNVYGLRDGRRGVFSCFCYLTIDVKLVSLNSYSLLSFPHRLWDTSCPIHTGICLPTSVTTR